MYICIYICIYVYIFVYTYIYVCVCVCVYPGNREIFSVPSEKTKFPY